VGSVKGWRRLGVVLSVVWFLGAFLYLWIDQRDSTTKSAWMLYDYCTRDNVEKGTKRDCIAERDKQWSVMPQALETAGLAAAPIPIVWLLATIIYFVGRWVRAGFKT